MTPTDPNSNVPAFFVEHTRKGATIRRTDYTYNRKDTGDIARVWADDMDEGDSLTIRDSKFRIGANGDQRGGYQVRACYMLVDGEHLHISGATINGIGANF